MKRLLFSGILVVVLLIPALIPAQHNNSELPTSIRADGSAPDGSAMLDIQSSDKGVLFTRMDSVQRTSIANPATGLLVYQSDKQAGFYYYDGSKWVPIHGELEAWSLLGYVPTPDFTCLRIEGRLAIDPQSQSVTVSGDLAYVLDIAGIKVIDVGNPSNPWLRGILPIGMRPTRLAVSGDYAYVFENQSRALYVVDVSNPDSLALRGSLAIGSSAAALAVSGDYAYLITEDLIIIDVSNPDTLVLLGNVFIGYELQGLTVSNNFAYVVDQYDNVLKTVDVSNPDTLIIKGNLTIGEEPIDVAVSENYAYVIDQASDDLKVIEVSDPTTPELIGSLSIGSFPVALTVEGAFVYVIDDSDNKLKIIDVSNPASPSLHSSLTIGPEPRDVAASDHMVYIVDDHDNDLKVIGTSCGNSILTLNPITNQVEEGFSLWKIRGPDIYNVNSGHVGIGPGNTTPASPLTLQGASLDNYLCRMENTQSSFGYKGLKIRAGNNSSAASFIEFFNGLDNPVGSITWNGTHTLYNATSDLRLKTDIVDTRKEALSLLEDLRIVDYKMKLGDGSIGTGYIAQEVLDIYPAMVSYDEVNDNYSVGTNLLIPILHKAILEQQELIDELKTKANKVEVLEAKLTKIEAMLSSHKE